jgi:glycosyltransferase involved in cell wall biosynthesis
MRLLLVDNAHIYKTPDGKLYAPSIYNDDFFKRYLSVFEEVHFLAKTKHVDTIDPDRFIELTASGLKVIELPWYQGVLEMSSVFRGLMHVYRSAGDTCECAIFRVCQMESYFSFLIRQNRSPFFLEVVNDPDTFTDLPRFMQLVNKFMLRIMLKTARGASFVTERILQNKYLPATRSADFLEAHYSSVELPKSVFGKPKQYSRESCGRMTLVHVANSIMDDTKGHIALLKAVKHVRDSGYFLKLVLIGDGPFAEDLRLLATETLGIEKSVDFIGRLHDRRELFERLYTADMFVYPTRLEGLPRSLIEAMAAGLPCLSTPIAGIPELLRSEYLFAPTDYEGFALKIIALIERPEELQRMSQENLDMARKYEADILNARRRTFYSGIRNIVLDDAEATKIERHRG